MLSNDEASPSLIARVQCLSRQIALINSLCSARMPAPTQEIRSNVDMIQVHSLPVSSSKGRSTERCIDIEYRVWRTRKR